MTWKCFNCSHENENNYSICTKCSTLINMWSCPKCFNKFCDKHNDKCSDCGYQKKNIKPKINEQYFSICLDNFNDITKQITYCSSQCDSLVHFECQKEWLKKSSTCSVCRSIWNESKLIKLN